MTCVYSLKDLEADIEKCRKQLIALGFTDMKNKIIIPKFMIHKKVVGLTTILSAHPVKFGIAINSDFIKVCERSELLNCIAHEVCHCVDGCFNHSPTWKSVTDKLSKYGGYEITTYCSSDAWRNFRSQNCKYTITCENCGSTISYSREGNVVSYFKWLKKNGLENSNYICLKCNSKKLKFTQNY